MGVQEIVVFQLTDALRVFGEDFVGRVARAINAVNADSSITVDFSRPVSLIFFGTVLVDAVLDARDSHAWLWIGWLVVSAALALQLSRRR